MSESNHLRPPNVYASWLDFAVETFDTRGSWVEWPLINDKDVDREAIRDAARSELRAPRAAAQEQWDARDEAHRLAGRPPENPAES